MKLNLKVSLVLPVYNGEKFIERCIESIISQSYAEFELIIINDGSTDQTALQIKRFEDKRIRVFNNKVNLGISNSLNRGIENSNGEYIFRMDVDDLMHKRRIEYQLKFMEYFKLDWSACGGEKNVNLISNRNDDLAFDAVLDPRKAFVIAGLCIKNTFVHGSVAFRRDFLLGYSLEYKLVKAEDLRLWVDFLEAGAKMGYLDLRLYDYYINKEGLYQKNKLSIDIEAKRYHREAIQHTFSQIHWNRESWYSLISILKNMFTLDGFKGYLKIVYYAFLLK